MGNKNVENDDGVDFEKNVCKDSYVASDSGIIYISLIQIILNIYLTLI